ncbi:MAG: DegT/DnrJ/EryC1/StrS family aminotransferase [Planctomycetes bacterium]|nr:DegT/DnrJ/EryC1/StrS family aminotransferase [Planctomycetota bacterium]
MTETLALLGGTPVRSTQLPFHRASLGPEEEAEVVDTLRSGWITTGPKTKKFEAEFATYVGAAHAIAVNSCTAGLHVALVALGVGPGDEVITSPMTFAASANVVVHVGATPVFADCLPGTLTLDPKEVERRITPRTKAILVVHYIGIPCEMDELSALAAARGLPILEDAAHAIETLYKGRKVGCLGRVAAFSFYATKNVTTGEGGMVTTDDAALADRIRILSLHGISRDAWKRYSAEGYRHYEILEAGYKYNMSDIQASLGLHQLRKVDGFWRRRKELVELYDAGFREIPELRPVPQATAPGNRNAYHLYPVLVQPERLTTDRDGVLAALQAENLGLGVHFRAVHLSPFYEKRFGHRRGTYPVAEAAGDRLLSLPFFPAMTDDDVASVLEAVRKVAQYRSTEVGDP